MNRKAVKIYCSEEEYEIIKIHADECGKSVSGYLREIALYGNAICINHDVILEHTKIINKFTTEMHLIITMLVQTKQAFPKDIEVMVSLLEEISKNQKTMLRGALRESQGVRKYIKKLYSK